MKTMSQNHGKISDHFRGLGTVTRDIVVQRAREIALINGRGPNHYRQDDFMEAKRELTGALPEMDGDMGEDPTEYLVAWDESPDAAGHPAAKIGPDDELPIALLLMEEGMEEAEHEQMVEGARNPRNQE